VVGDIKLVVLLLVVRTPILAVLVAVVSTAILETIPHNLGFQRGTVAKCRAGLHGRVRVTGVIVVIYGDAVSLFRSRRWRAAVLERGARRRISSR
jgi:hypothetical protein